MTPTLLRQVWSQIESTQANLLLQLDDSSLAEFLLGRIQNERGLDRTEADLLHHYIHTKIPLIRDLAQSRLVGSV
jgi:hypothetical protein